MRKVLVGLSGGIDSSVAMYLLLKQGYEVEGITMLIWSKDSPYPAPVSPNSCYNPDKSEDLAKIDEICAKLGVRHHVVDCSRLYERNVLANFRSEYMNARTPNPCIWCNALIKFGAMLDIARETLDFDFFATGHYARISKCGNRFRLMKAVDGKKDQSYFLSRLSQKQLSATLFPLGDHTKDEIRRIDESLGFHAPGAVESQDFYGGDYSDLLSTPDRNGDIVLVDDGRKIGEHRGFWHYTIGQRKGLGIAWSEPLYVISLDPLANRVYVGTKERTFSSFLVAGNVNYVGFDSFDSRVYTVKIRSTSSGAPAFVSSTDEGFRADFLSPVMALTPGQSAVVYDGDVVVASGIIL